MKLRFLLSLLCCQGLLFGQNASAERAIRVVRVHGDAAAFANLFKGEPGVDCQGDARLRAVVLKGGASDVERVESKIRELDGMANSPSAKDVELTTFVVAGSMEPIKDSQEISGESLAPVVRQLRSIFPYKSYQILSTMLLRITQGAGPYRSAGSLKWRPQNPDTDRSALGYSLSFGPLSVSTDGWISIAEVRFDTSVPLKSIVVLKNGATNTESANQSVQISTRVDLREGQKVVVGSTTIADLDVGLFLVVSARVTQ